MKKWFLSVLVVISLAGCGDFEWFPDTDSIGPSPNPPPPGSIVTDVQADTVVSFIPYTVAGLADATTTSISVRGDSSSQYSINDGTLTSTTGTVKNGDKVIVQNISSNLGANLSISTVLQIGGASATYTSTTGTLVFPTKSGISTGTTVDSNPAIIPATLPNGFVFGNPTTISIASDSSPNSSILINGILSASPSPIVVGDRLTLRHVAAASSGQTVTTKADIKGSGSSTYTVTFKSITQ